MASPWAVLPRALGVLLIFLALTQPLWAITTSAGGSVAARVSYYGDHRVREATIGFSLKITEDSSYSDPEFSQPRMANVLGTVRSLSVAALALMGVSLLLGLLGIPFRGLRSLGLPLDLGGLALAGTAAAYLPIFLPAAANEEVYSGVASAWGSSAEGLFNTSWAPAMGWTLMVGAAVVVAVAVALGILLRSHPQPGTDGA